MGDSACRPYNLGGEAVPSSLTAAARAPPGYAAGAHACVRRGPADHRAHHSRLSDQQMMLWCGGTRSSADDGGRLAAVVPALEGRHPSTWSPAPHLARHAHAPGIAVRSSRIEDATSAAKRSVHDHALAARQMLRRRGDRLDGRPALLRDAPLVCERPRRAHTSVRTSQSYPPSSFETNSTMNGFHAYALLENSTPACSDARGACRPFRSTCCPVNGGAGSAHRAGDASVDTSC